MTVSQKLALVISARWLRALIPQSPSCLQERKPGLWGKRGDNMFGFLSQKKSPGLTGIICGIEIHLRCMKIPVPLTTFILTLLKVSKK